MKLVVSNATVGYERTSPLQRAVNFEVSSGEVCCILGPNGCGKTTLVKSLLGMQPLLGGRVSIDGSDLSSWSAAQLADQVAYVAQRQGQGFPFTVREVVMLGRLAKSDSFSGKPSRTDYHIVENAMAEMGIRHLRDRPYLDISGGELQMVMFARALAQEPQLLILDEPTAALDYGNAMRVVGKVRYLARRGFAVLMITHSPDHAFMTGANVALFHRDRPMVFGDAASVVTRENIQNAYGVSVRLVEFATEDGRVMRMCAPEFDDEPCEKEEQ